MMRVSFLFVIFLILAGCNSGSTPTASDIEQGYENLNANAEEI